MENYCAFCDDHKCRKFEEYEFARLDVSDADELYHGNCIELSKLSRYIDYLKSRLEENGIEYRRAYPSD